METPPSVVYEDERLVAVSKPAGEVVIAGRGTVGEPLSERLARSLGRRLFVIHRIDREASGLVLFAKDSSTHRSLCSQFESRTVRKTYLALVLGRLDEDGEISLPIRTFGSGRMGVGDEGKPSLTRYRVRESLDGATLLEVEPLSGRRHQIRVHLYSMGHPILGDPLYGAPRPVPPSAGLPRQRPTPELRRVGGAPRLMLHAWKLGLPGDRPLLLEAAPGEDFLEVLAGRGGVRTF